MRKAMGFGLAVLAACGSKAKPVEPPQVEIVDASAPVVDAAPPEPEAAAPEAAPPPKAMALCSVGGDPIATRQCLVWQSGCADAMVLAVGGKPFRKCAAQKPECDETEEKLVMASQRIAPGTRACKTKFYLAKEVVIGDSTWRVCPEDAEDKELSTLWKRVVSTCRAPITP